LHIQPRRKRRELDIQGGDELQVSIPMPGRVAILICMTVEFPELGRLLPITGYGTCCSCPSGTDTKNGYLRVPSLRPMARAMKTECYVVASVHAGRHYRPSRTCGIQYAQSAVFSPSDFQFPHDARY